MKEKSYLVVAATAALLFTLSSLTAKQPSKPPRGGTDILHWNIRKEMTNEGAVSNATAFVSAKQNQQGNANNQRLDLTIRRLETNSTYRLFAVLDDDTNFVHASDFTTDAKGNATLRYMKVGSSNGKGLGKGKSPLPADLDPISHIRELAVGNVHTQAVFTADLSAPDKLQYLIKRKFTAGGVTSQLRLKATTRQVQFRLYTWGLAPGTNYWLAVNDAVVAGGNSETNGNLSFLSLPVNAADILDVHKLAIWDGTSNSVISTLLP